MNEACCFGCDSFRTGSVEDSMTQSLMSQSAPAHIPAWNVNELVWRFPVGRSEECSSTPVDT